MREPKAIILIFILLFVGLVFQSTLFEFLRVFNARPDFVLLVIVYAALKRGPMAGMFTGFAGGIMEGFFSPPYGFHALAKTIIGFILGKFEGILSIDPFFMKILLVLGATIVKGIFTGLGHLVFGISGPPFFTFAGCVLVEAVYNALFAPILFFLMKKMSVFKNKSAETV
jgi:rod shape-determining protein MreD